METRVIIIGQEQTEPKKLKPIEFNKVLNKNCQLSNSMKLPKDWKNIELIARLYGVTDYDLMFAYDDIRDRGHLYLGKFNDGVVE